MSQWYFEGDSVASISIDNRALQYGDGLFETIAIRDGEPRLLSLHLERLSDGCDRLGINAPRAADLQESLNFAISSSGIPNDFAAAKILVSAGSGPRGYRRPANPETRFWIGIFPSRRRENVDYRDGVNARLCRTRLAIQPQLGGIKTVSRLEQVLAQAEWDQPDIAEGLMLDTDGNLICGTMSNVFVVIGNDIATPAITRCGVAGVMRRHVLTLLADAGTTCAVRDIPPVELQSASEVFLTNSQFGVLPVKSCNAYRWAPGPVTRHVMSLAADSGISECAA